MAEHAYPGAPADPSPSSYVVTGQDIRPVPDPTVLTARATEAAKEELRREIFCLREVLEQRLNGMDTAVKLIERWREGLPRQLHEAMLQAATVIDQRFLTIEERFHTVDEKFSAVRDQFSERDVRTEQASTAAKEAVATALQAAKEAVGAALQAAKEAVAAQNTASTNAILKSETSTDKRIDETVRLLNSTTGGLEARFSIITEQSKNTMTRQEVEQLFRTVSDKIDGPTGLAMRLESTIARGTGRSDQEARSTQSNQWIVGAIIGGLALLITLAAIALKIH